MKRILCVILMCVVAFPALAQMKKTEPPPNPDKIAVLKKIRAQGQNLDYVYLGRRFGMDAWVISGPGVMQVLYTAPGGLSAIVGGILVGPDGQEVSTAMQREFTQKNPARAQKMLEMARQVPTDAKKQAADAPLASKSDKIWDRLAGLGLVTAVAANVSKPVPIVYMVLDPQQPGSKTAWEKISGLADRGLVVAHAVPLATQSADRLLDIAYVLGSEKRRALWDALLAGTMSPPGETVDPKGAVAMNDNVTFARDLKIYTVPFFLYRVPGANGSWGPVRAVKGLPNDWGVILSDMGIPKE
jgi:hypothetical protein